MRTRALDFRRSLPLLFLGGIFLAGALCGSALYDTLSEESAGTLMLLLSGMPAGEAFHFWGCLGAVFLSNFLMLALLFLCGFCAVSQPVIALLPFVKGLGFGLVAAGSAVLLSSYSAFFWLRFFPGAFFSTVLLLLCARRSMELSLFVYRAVFGRRGGSGSPGEGRFLPAAYTAHYLSLMLLCAGGSLLSAVFDLIYEAVSSA